MGLAGFSERGGRGKVLRMLGGQGRWFAGRWVMVGGGYSVCARIDREERKLYGALCLD